VSVAVPAAAGRSAAQQSFFAPCPRGLEQVLAGELRALGAAAVAVAGGGVAFEGERAVAMLANLHSRIASRVLMRVAQGRYRDDDDLYRLANRTEWEHWFEPARTLRVDVSAIRSPLRSLNFATLRIKDGLVDRFRARTGERPSIDTARPEVRVFGFLQQRDAALYLDLSGEPLFKRGWRAERDDRGEAPLKENLAAGLLALAGWTPAQPLYDPFCGSGTIVIEAAQQALEIAPGLSRRFAFERLLDFDAAHWAALRAGALRAVRSTAAGGGDAPRIAASDSDPRAIEQARRNAQRAGLPEGLLRLSQRDAAHATPPFDGPGTIVSNPPYGERVELDARGGADWAAIGANLRQRFGGWSAWMLSSDLALPRRLGLNARRRAPLFNGAIECRLFGFEVFAAGELRPRRGARSPG